MQSTNKSAKFPLRVKGGSDTQQASIAFGHIGNSPGLLGSNSDFVFIGTRDEKKFLAFQHKDGKVGVGTTTPTEDLTVRTSKENADIHFTSGKAAGKVALLTMEAGGSTKLSTSTGDVESAKFEVKDFTEIVFSNAGKSAQTTFDRANPPPNLPKGAEFEPPVVEFRSGNVGMGVETPEKLLHVGGDHWSQGQLILKNGFGRATMLSELTEMIQLGEGSDSQALQAGSEGAEGESTNVMDAFTKLVRLVRRNKLRLQKQASSIEQMESTLARLRA